MRIFAEYVNALESLGACGWAIWNRRSSRLLLDAFLSYAPGDIKVFFVAGNKHAELATLLRLPPTQTITDEFRRHGIPHGQLLAEFGRVEKNLAEAAEHYFRPDELLVTTYNKAKHSVPGAVSLHNAHHRPKDPRMLWSALRDRRQRRRALSCRSLGT